MDFLLFIILKIIIIMIYYLELNFIYINILLLLENYKLLLNFQHQILLLIFSID